MQRVSGRLRDAAWPIMTGALLGLAVTTMAIGRYFSWDEAVFFSQSGGLDGSRTAPLTLVASRGLGSPFLIRVIRVFVDGLAGVRLVWAVITVSLLVFGARRLRRHVGDRGALLFLGVYGTFWLFWAFASSFYAMLLAGVFTMIAATFYLDLVTAPPAKRSLWPASIGFGLFMTASLAMRPIEAVLSATALVVHLCVFNWGALRARFRYFATSVAVVAVAFGVPYTIDSISRFGSLTARVRSGLNQGWPQGLRWNVPEYLGVWGGHFNKSSFETMPGWPRWIIYAGMIAAVTVIVVALARRRRTFARGPAGAFIAVAAAQFAFFLFWGGEIQERYHFTSMIFMAALLAWAVTQGGFSLRGRWRGIVALGIVAWFVAQLALVGPYNEAWDSAGRRIDGIVKTMRTLADDGSCRAFVQTATPQIAVGSGCSARAYGTWENAVELGTESAGEGRPTFIYGPAKAATSPVPDGWTTVTVGYYALWYWLPPTPDAGS